MKFINSKTHSILDYLAAVLLIASPYLFGFNDGSIAHYMPVALGIATIILSLLTNYEGGISKVISFRLHLILDVCQALLLGLSPWLFGFADRVYQPHVLMAVAELLIIFFTKWPRQADITVTRPL